MSDKITEGCSKLSSNMWYACNVSIPPKRLGSDYVQKVCKGYPEKCQWYKFIKEASSKPDYTIEY